MSASITDSKSEPMRVVSWTLLIATDSWVSDRLSRGKSVSAAALTQEFELDFDQLDFIMDRFESRMTKAVAQEIWDHDAYLEAWSSTPTPLWDVPGLTVELISFCDFSTRRALVKWKKAVYKIWTRDAISALASFHCHCPLYSALFFAKSGDAWVVLTHFDATSQWVEVPFPSDASLLSVLRTFAERSDVSAHVHFWCRRWQLTRMFTSLDLIEDEYEDCDRFVEIPAQYLTVTLNKATAIDMGVFVIERKTVDGQWPMAKSKDTWRQFETGDIIDAKDSFNNWIDAVILEVAESGSVMEDKLKVHFIGWSKRYDEYVPTDDEHIARRGTHTTGPQPRVAF